MAVGGGTAVGDAGKGATATGVVVTAGTATVEGFAGWALLTGGTTFGRAMEGGGSGGGAGGAVCAEADHATMAANRTLTHDFGALPSSVFIENRGEI
jgi:hypothetical protein